MSLDTISIRGEISAMTNLPETVRPCMSKTCKGTMRAQLRQYKSTPGEWKLVFQCATCMTVFLPRKGKAQLDERVVAADIEEQDLEALASSVLQRIREADDSE